MLEEIPTDTASNADSKNFPLKSVPLNFLKTFSPKILFKVANVNSKFSFTELKSKLS